MATVNDTILSALQIPQNIIDQHSQLNSLVTENPIKVPVKKAAQFMGIHEDTLREMIDEGRCPFALGMHKSKFRNRYTVIPTYNFYMWQTQWFLVWLMSTRGEETLMQKGVF